MRTLFTVWRNYYLDNMAQMRIFKNSFFAVGCVLLAILFEFPSAYGQLNHRQLMNGYTSHAQQMPSISVATEFSSQVAENELESRFEKSVVDRQRKLSALSAEQRELIRKELKLPKGRNAVHEFFAERDGESLELFHSWNQTAGVYEFFNGNHREVRRYSRDGDVVRILQFGVVQPKLRNPNPNVWVIKEFNETHNRTLVRSESKVALLAMLPVGPFMGLFHRSIDEKFSSGFDLFWEDTTDINFWGKSGDADVYLKQDPDEADNWLVACFDDPRKTIVPLWLAEVYAPKIDSLDAKYLPVIIDVVAQLPKNESTLVPDDIYIRSLSLFQERTNVEQFQGYPRSIRHLIPISWESSEMGFNVNAPLLDFLMQVTDLTIEPKDRDAIVIEDGSDYYDYDRKIGWTIGETDPPIARDRSFARSVLWSMAIAVLLIGSVSYYKRK